MCREALAEAIEFVTRYRHVLATADVAGRFEALMDAVPPVSAREAPDPKSDPQRIELAFMPYHDPFVPGARWAAATEPLPVAPLRFCSADGRYVLREFPHPAEGKSSFHLITENDVQTERIELLLDGERCRIGPGGIIDPESAGCTISKDTRIFIRSAPPG